MKRTPTWCPVGNGGGGLLVGLLGLWEVVARRHVGTWRYLAHVEGDFRIETDQRGVLLFSHEPALGTAVSGTLLPQEKKWLETTLCTSGGEAGEAGVARVRYSEKTESMMYAFRPPGSQEFRPPTAAYRAMTSQEANRVSAESAVALANKASRILEKGLASCSAGSWQLAKRDLNC
ncbi:mut-7, partial [Symbiodinium sp. CCMP2456]